MPIHEKKNAQIQLLFPQIWRLENWSRKCFHPSFVFPFVKEKHKYLSEFARKRPASAWIGGEKKILFINFFPASAWMRPMSTRTHSLVWVDRARICTDEGIYRLGNLKMDATMRPCQGRPSSHCPRRSVRPCLSSLTILSRCPETG
jgi:hypothetical protein